MNRYFNDACTVRGIKWLALAIVFLSLVSGCSNQRTSGEVNGEEAGLPTEVGYISATEAEKLAEQFLMYNEGARATAAGGLKLVYQEPIDSISLRSALSYKHQDKPSYYVFNTGDNQGFVIVSANDATYPILGYSDEGAFPNAKEIPDGLRNLLADYSYEIQHIWSKGATLTGEKRSAINQLRSLSLEDGVSLKAASNEATSVAPLMADIHWDQSPYYNDYCPEGTPVGCVATALSQIMRYWEYPDEGVGTHRSTTDWQVADYNHKLNWNNMPKALLRRPNHDVAQFCYDVAVGLNMEFRKGNSATYHRYVMPLIVNHYKYDKNARQVFRDYVGTEEWTRLIRAELQANRPVQLGGSGRGGGHSFVCDGFSSNGYFHINWGWGGMSDGYFLINRLNPIDLGVGGGMGGGFNYGQDMVIGIRPPHTPDPQPTPEEGNEEGDLDYCAGSGRNARSTFIQSVSIANVTNETKSAEGGYNYFPDKHIKLEPGKSYRLTVKPGSLYGNYREYWNVWIDYNNDKVFSSSERLLGFITTNSNPVSYTINVPSDAQGTVRMRVSMKWNAFAEPCEVFDFGEVEDYPITFAAEKPAPVEPTPVPTPVPTPEPEPVVPTPEPEPTPSVTYPVSKAKSGEFAYISGVQFGQVSNLNNVSGLYQDFTNIKFITGKGSSLNYKLTPSFPTGRSYNAYWRVWIDYNNNGVFENNEIIINRYDYRRLEGWFSIPGYAKSGQYRMRVSFKLFEAPRGDEIFNYGEVEDYTIVIK